MNLLDNIKANNFLFNNSIINWPEGVDYTGPGRVLQYTISDTLELFEKHLKTQPEDWYYRIHPVNYTLNSYGYRAPEFKDINWSESVVVFGCSNTFGTGLDDKDTITSRLEELIKCPVINMGCTGSAIDYSLYNSVILKNICSKPKAVVHLWTSVDRTTHYLEKRTRSYGVWPTKKPIPYFDEWLKEPSHAATIATFASMITKHLWSNTKLFEATTFQKTYDVLKCYHIPLDTEQERARDLLHRGRENAKDVAKIIADNIC